MIRDDRDSYQVRLVAVACLEYVVAAQTYPGRCLAAVVPACRDSRGSREVQGTESRDRGVICRIFTRATKMLNTSTNTCIVFFFWEEIHAYLGRDPSTTWAWDGCHSRPAPGPCRWTLLLFLSPNFARSPPPRSTTSMQLYGTIFNSLRIKRRRQKKIDGITKPVGTFGTVQNVLTGQRSISAVQVKHVDARRSKLPDWP
jgi:hypothetical protein